MTGRSAIPTLKNRTRQFVIDGEAVVLGVDGLSDFDALYSRQHDEQVQLYAFDVYFGSAMGILDWLGQESQKKNPPK